MQIISSTNNKAVKAIRSLHSRKGRKATAGFWVEGIRLVGVASEQGAAIEQLVVCQDLLTSSFAYELIARLESLGTQVLRVTERVFASLSVKQGPQGLGAVVRQNWGTLPEQLEPGQLWVALREVQDPGNLGSIMRTADATGCTGLILIGDCTDPYDPSAVRGSMGSVFALRLVQVAEADFLRWQKLHSINLIGSSGAAKLDYRQANYIRPLVLLSGSERQGLPDSLLQACDNLVSIPMTGAADSLNLAVATGIVLYEALYQNEKLRENR